MGERFPEEKMKRCLILGAGGFIGKAICRQLYAAYDITAYDRQKSDELDELKKVKQIIGDFVSTTDFTDILQGIDVVIHLISTTLPSDDTAHIREEINENLIPTVSLLESMVKTGVKEILFVSSGGTVYGETGEKINDVKAPLKPICSYGVQKKVIEAYLQFYGIRYGMNYKIARISNPYGLGQDTNKPQGVIPIFIRNLLNNKPITVYGDGTDVRDYIYLDDVTRVIERMLAYEGEEHIFNVGSGEVYSLNQIIDKITKVANISYRAVEYQKARKCDVHRAMLEVESTWEALGYRPQTTLDEGIRELYTRLCKKKS